MSQSVPKKEMAPRLRREVWFSRTRTYCLWLTLWTTGTSRESCGLMMVLPVSFQVVQTTLASVSSSIHGVVIGPDGLLYVSVFNIDDPNSGWVLRFDPNTGAFLDLFIESNSENNLHRPEGLVFNPDGSKLYITSFRDIDPNVIDTDKILVFDAETGVYLDEDKIELYAVGNPRAFAQAILFGPGGKLFVPINGGSPETKGSVRSYDVESKMFDELVPPASEEGPLGEPWFLTFGNTDPVTLAYHSEEVMG